MKIGNILEGLILESLMDFEDDVDLIYDTYFKDDYNQIIETGKVSETMFQPVRTTTDILESPLAIKLNELNLCRLEINTKNGNYYSPIRRTISLGINRAALDFVLSYNGNLLDASKRVDNGRSLLEEFKGVTIKSSIHHELTHWADDTLYNSHIENTLDNHNQSGKPITGLNGSTNINTHHMELEAQIHNIYQLHREYNSIWNKLSFDDLINYSPSLNLIRSQLIGTPLYDTWKRKLKTRMYREGLLGAKMVNS